MTLKEAIKARHSVRCYQDRPFDAVIVDKLNAKIAELNKEGGLHLQFVLNEPKAFKGVFAYGKFSNVTNYVIVAGEKSDDLDERAGYFGEALVLYMQTLGLNSCWVGLSYHKVNGTYELNSNEKIVCYIAVGYGETQGVGHKTKTIEQLGDVKSDSPSWYIDGVEAARLAPTAINQQKFKFKYIATDSKGNGLVRAEKGFSLVGYTSMDLGIAKYNFRIGAAPVNVIFKE